MDGHFLSVTGYGLPPCRGLCLFEGIFSQAKNKILWRHIDSPERKKDDILACAFCSFVAKSGVFDFGDIFFPLSLNVRMPPRLIVFLSVDRM